MDYIYLIMSSLGTVAFIVATVLKGEEIKKNLFFVITGSILIGTSYLFTPAGINGAVSSFIGCSQAVINYFYNIRNKKIPIWVIVLYAILFAGMNLAVINSPVGLLALFASLCFVGMVSAKNGKGFRLWQLLNCSLWVTYDFLSHSYGPLSTHLILFGFTVFGIIINDLKKEKI